MTRTPSIPKAAAWMAGWLVLMIVIAIAGREAMRELNVFVVMEIRCLIGFVMFYPLVRAAGGLAAMRTTRPLQHVVRNVTHYGAQLGWFYAITLIALGEVVAIEFTMPIWTAILAALFLGERMTLHKIVAIALGMIGVIVIVRPVAGELNPGQLVALAAAVGFGVSIASVKYLTRTDSTVQIIFWMLVLQAAFGLIPSLLTWQTPSLAVWPWLVVIAFCGTFSHYCMTRAFHHADATVAIPMDFARVPLTALVGWMLYDERLDALSAVGAAIILLGNLLNLRARRPNPAAPPSSP